MTIAFSRSDEAPASEANMSAPIYCVRVPASTSNCGPGFDTLGLAFQLYNEVIVARRDDGAIRYAGDDARFQKQEQAMIEEIAGTFFERSGVEPFGFSFEIRGEVPLARGLGSSVTVRAGVLAGLNAIAGDPLDRRAIAELVTELEGHPDNAVAAVFGG